MIVVRGGKIADVGPRSAHIAEKEYEVFTDTDKMKNPKIELIAPREDDTSDYAVVACANGESYALTLAVPQIFWVMCRRMTMLPEMWNQRRSHGGIGIYDGEHGGRTVPSGNGYCDDESWRDCKTTDCRL